MSDTALHPSTSPLQGTNPPRETDLGAIYRGNLMSWLTTVDHKRIGILYGVTALVFALIGGVEAMLIRTQLIVPNNDFLSADIFNAMFTMHGVTMIFMFVMPLNAAFFNYLIPLQIGARDVAFPRLNALSYWVFLFGGILFHLSFFIGELPRVGWFGYANLTSAQYSGSGTDFWVIGLQVLGLSSLIASINFIVTIINLRAPGMSMLRLPIFTWTSLLTNILLLMALPVITVALFQVFFDRLFGSGIFDPTSGGNVLLWQHFFWIFGHPEVYILILPPMGYVSEIIPVSARKPLFGYAAMIAATVSIAFLGFSVWAHHMFTVGMGPLANAIFSAATMLIAVPTGVKIFNWLATMWGGKIHFTAAMLFCVGFIAQFTIGGLSGIMHASPPIDTQHQDSYFVVAHFHYVLIGGSVFGLLAAVHFWFPKVTGRLMSERLGKLTFWMAFIGFNTTFFPQHFLGADGMPRRIYTYQEGFGFELWNFVSSIGAYLTALAALIFLYNLIRSIRHGTPSGGDPWDARTLEWSISSPPPEYNFARLPEVRALDDFWYSKRVAKDFKPQGTAEVILPNPTAWPLILGFGIALLAAGFLIWIPLSFIGVLTMLVSGYAWAFAPFEDHPPDDHTPSDQPPKEDN